MFRRKIYEAGEDDPETVAIKSKIENLHQVRSFEISHFLSSLICPAAIYELTEFRV
jgi:hypothetical protein